MTAPDPAAATEALDEARRALLSINGFLRHNCGFTPQHWLRKRIKRALEKIGSVPARQSEPRSDGEPE